MGGAASGTSHLATPCNTLELAGTVGKLSVWTTLGSPALILGTTFLPVAAQTNGSSSDSIKVSSVQESRTSSAESRTRRPGGPGLDASPKRTPLRPYREFLTPDSHPSVLPRCTSSLRLPDRSERTSEKISPGRSWGYLARMQPSSQTLVPPELPLCPQSELQCVPQLTIAAT